MANSKIKSLLNKLPKNPGVYKMKDEKNEIIYVGKAKSLRNRVKSYFIDKNQTLKTRVMVSKINDIEWIEVGSDLEALFLETNLIKEYRPKYNVLMKDDKNFVYIKITKEDFPRIELVRKVEEDGAKYIGPKTAAYKVEKTLKLLQKLFTYRSCNLDIDFINIGKVKITNKTIAFPCLDFYIKRCEAPCIAKIIPEDYQKNIKEIELFLEGKSAEIEKNLKTEMQNLVNEKKFEKAAKIRDKLQIIKDLKQKQIVTSPDHQNADVFAFVLENEKAYMNLFIIRDGKVLDQENFILDAPIDSESEIMESFIFQYYQKTKNFPEEIIIPAELSNPDLFEDWIRNQAGRKILLIQPQKGKKHKLLDLALKNAESFKKQQKARWEIESLYPNELEELKNILNLKKNPKRIECYDISHLSGTNTVASMVVFENGIPKKSDYRKFRIKDLKEGMIDDFKSMEEILRRRLSRFAKSSEGLKIKKAKKSNLVEINKLFKERDRKTENQEFEGFYLIYSQDKLAGMIRVLEIKEQYLIRSFYVSPKFRSKGLGRILMSYALDKTDSSRIYLACFEKLRDFYVNLGFEEIKKFPDAIQSYVTEFEKLKLFVFDKNKQKDSSFDEKPDLIVIDGGKGQLSSVYGVMKTLGLDIPLISLAKREEEVFIPEKSLPLLIPKDSKALYLLRRIRDEAHRFAITFQKQSRKKDLNSSFLDNIPGVGDNIKMKLLNAFSSLEMIKKANKVEIAALTGDKLAEKIVSYLNQTNA